MWALLVATLLASDLPPKGTGDAPICTPTSSDCVVCHGTRSNPWMKYGSLGLSAVILAAWAIHARKQPASSA